MKLFYTSVAAALLVAQTPLAAALNYDDPIEASRARCNELAGREKSRCVFINNRIERLRLRQADSAVDRTNTLRDRRKIIDNKPRTDIRRIGSYDLERLRMHSRDGGNARRMIQLRDAAARSECQNLEGTAKYQCIRKNNKQSTRGQTR